MRIIQRPQLLRLALLALSVAAVATLGFGLYRDTTALTMIGASLGDQEKLDGKLLHSVGSVIENLAFRTRIQALTLSGMFGGLILFALRGRPTAERKEA